MPTPKSRLKKVLERLVDQLFFFGIIAMFIAVVFGIFYLKYSIYKERYPQASAWTFFFK